MVFLCKACGDDNMYVASVLNRMGMICSERTEYHALGYFNEALQIRKNLLGGNDHLVADTLYASAVVLARLGRYEASMERYHEALRIQMADSQDSNEVARTLGGKHVLHDPIPFPIQPVTLINRMLFTTQEWVAVITTTGHSI